MDRRPKRAKAPSQSAGKGRRTKQTPELTEQGSGDSESTVTLPDHDSFSLKEAELRRQGNLEKIHDALQLLSNGDHAKVLDALQNIRRFTADPPRLLIFETPTLEERHLVAVGRLLSIDNIQIQREAMSLMREGGYGEAICQAIVNAWTTLKVELKPFAIELISSCGPDAASIAIEQVASAMLDCDSETRRAASKCVLRLFDEYRLLLPSLLEVLKASDDSVVRTDLVLAITRIFGTRVSHCACELLTYLPADLLKETLRSLGEDGRRVRFAVSKALSAEAYDPADWSELWTITEIGMIVEWGKPNGGSEKDRDAARTAARRLKDRYPSMFRKFGRKYRFNKVMLARHAKNPNPDFFRTSSDESD